MSPLEKKAVQHCLDLLKNVETVEVWKIVNKTLEHHNTILVEQKRILDNLSIASAEHVSKYVNQAKDWLAELLKNEA